ETGWGGIGTYAFHMARGMVARGYFVTVLCGHAAEPSETTEGNLRIVRQIPPNLSPAERSELVATLLEQQIEQNRIDIVEFAEYGGDGLVFQRRNRQFPTVVKLHCPTRLCSIGESPAWQAPLRWLYFGQRGQKVEKMERESVARASVVI